MQYTKRICMLADSHDLYDDRIYWKEAVSLSRAGYEVHYVLASDRSESGITNEGIRFIRIKKIIYFKNRYFNYLLKLLLPGGLYKEMLNSADSIKADVYHLHDLKINLIGKKLKNLSWKPAVIYDVHEPYPENIIDYSPTSGLGTVIKKWYSAYIRRWENKCACKYDLIITTEENMRDRFRKFLPDDKVQIIFNYTNLENTGKLLDFKEKIWDAIYTGGITRLRGAMKILGAVRLAAKEKTDLKVLFLGTFFPPDLKMAMQEFIHSNNLENNVELHENVPYTQVADYYRKSRLGLGIFLPIPTHRIILQIKIFEYMNFGLPIIGSNFGHIERYINDNKAGLTVDPESEAEIAHALISILKNKNLYGELSMNALTASEKYKWHFMEDKLLGIYQKLLSNKIE
jgi:glycosyltransferase involved in cell wall biosynthesis